MENVATFAGYTVTVGAVASFLAQYLKKDWFPSEYRAALCRIFVAITCVGIHAVGAYVQGLPITVETLVMSALSYLSAAATYDHIFKR